MKKILLIILVAGFLFACTKDTTLPTYTPPVAQSLKIDSLKHTQDTVNVGDTIYLSVAGSVYDTLAVYSYLTVTSSASNSPVLSYGSASAPIKLSPVLASQNAADLNSFTSTVRLVGATQVHKAKLTVTGTFMSQLSLSSMGNGTATVTDKGVNTKTIYVQ